MAIGTIVATTGAAATVAVNSARHASRYEHYPLWAQIIILAIYIVAIIFMIMAIIELNKISINIDDKKNENLWIKLKNILRNIFK